MKLTKSQLKQIIREEIGKLNDYTDEEEIEKLDLPQLLMALQRLLDEWEEKEYLSDEARSRGYYEDIENLIAKYDPCAHPGESCEEAHQEESHDECIARGKEPPRESIGSKEVSDARFMVSDIYHDKKGIKT